MPVGPGLLEGTLRCWKIGRRRRSGHINRMIGAQRKSRDAIDIRPRQGLEPQNLRAIRRKFGDEAVPWCTIQGEGEILSGNVEISLRVHANGVRGSVVW